MQVTTIDRVIWEPGTYLEWRPHASIRPVPSPVAPSVNQQFHLHTAVSTGDVPSVWLAGTFEIEGLLDHEALRASFVEFLYRHDTLRSSFAVTPEGFGRQIIPLRAVTLQEQPGVSTATAEATGALLWSRLNAACSPLSFPTFLFAAIERPHRTSVICGFDHSTADGYSIALAIHELYRRYVSHAVPAGGTRPARGPLGSALPELAAAALAPTGSFVDFCRHEAQLEPLGLEDPRIASWAAFLRRCGGTTPQFPLDLGLVAGELAPQAGDVRSLLTAPEADRFEAMCRENGGSLYTGLLAILGLGINSLGGPAQVPILFPLHTRHKQRWEESFGWFTTNAPLVIAVDPAGEFSPSLAGTHASFRLGLALSEVTLGQVLGAVAEDFHRVHHDIFMVSYIDYRRLPGHQLHSRLAARHISNVTVADDAQFWIWRTAEGVAIRSRFPATDVAKAVISGLLDSVATRLGALGALS